MQAVIVDISYAKRALGLTLGEHFPSGKHGKDAP